MLVFFRPLASKAEEAVRAESSSSFVSGRAHHVQYAMLFAVNGVMMGACASPDEDAAHSGVTVGRYPLRGISGNGPRRALL